MQYNFANIRRDVIFVGNITAQREIIFSTFMLRAEALKRREKKRFTLGKHGSNEYGTSRKAKTQFRHFICFNGNLLGCKMFRCLCKAMYYKMLCYASPIATFTLKLDVSYDNITRESGLNKIRVCD